MFSWNFAKSAEAMFSRWAVKRVCKFLLKKKLGKFISGDIDLDQLDVQLTQGTIQLNDLALNVDYINKKLSEAVSFVVKEGSIGSLLVKMPWSGKGCQVEVNELELVISPCTDNVSTGGDESCVLDDNNNNNNSSYPMKYSTTRNEHDISDDPLKSTSIDVHEGVKTIAKMVKWLLTSFHVKIANIIVACDLSLLKEDKKTECLDTLVLRISEIECGTCISEDSDSNADVLGISRLTNFVKFQGAILELLKMDDDNQVFPHVSGCDEPILGSNKATCPVITGKSGGFGGNIKLSIPWKNGSMDIRKVDADVCIDPVVLRLQPSTIKWLFCSSDTYKNLDKNGRGFLNNKSRESVQLNAISLCHSSNSATVTNVSSEVIPVRGSSPVGFSLTQSEHLAEALLPESRLISDWVPYSTDKELDFGASVDQFFECFDGMRSSQSALGSSGMWNWTCSVFSAITAASSLASGSLHVPSEQQHVETNFRVTIAGISVVLSFHDEEHLHCSDPTTNNGVGLHMDYLGAECNEILLQLQICPEVRSVEGTVKHIEVAGFLNVQIDAMGSGLQEHNSANSLSALVCHLQAKVLGVLPTSLSYDLHYESDRLTGLVTDFPLGNKDCLMKITLFRTCGITNCKFTVQPSSSDCSLTRLTLFSMNLPPFILWVIFPVFNLVIDLLKEVGKSVEEENRGKEIALEAKKYGSHCDVKEGSSSHVTSLSTVECLRGDVSISSARVILCFPFEGGGDLTSFMSWKQFIALDFTSPSPLNKGYTLGCSPTVNVSSKKRYPSMAAQFLQLIVCDLDGYLITSTSNDIDKMIFCNGHSNNFSSCCFLSVTSRPGSYSVISMVWQRGQVTGPWIAKKARLLADLEQFRGKDDVVGGGYEYASASRVKDLEDLKSQTQQEMILSSSFFVHFELSQIMVKLSDSQYKDILCLLSQMLNGLSCVTSEAANDENKSSVTQSSIFMECDSAEILISPDSSESIRSSLQSELPGVWHQLKLKVQKFELLSVTNTGGIKGCDFFRLAHGEGKLLGFITGVPDQEFLLITCSNSSMKRGDGGGSNALSSRSAGSDIILMSDPKVSHNVTSVTVSCGSIIAVGGRLDWLGTMVSFFTLPSSDIEEANEDDISTREINKSHTTYFALKLVDVALCYEPYMKNLLVQREVADLESEFSDVKDDVGEQYVACLLAASSLTLSNSTLGDVADNAYQITVQDIGLLLHVVSEPNNFCGTYSVEHLQKTGYVKVAHEAFMEAVLRTTCSSSLLWEVELSKSHIYLEACHDTTAALIHLAAQLQQLFAPDVEESIVHLQNRWDNVQEVYHRNDFNNESQSLNCDAVASSSQRSSSKVILKDKSRMVGLMEEICEDAFQVKNNNTWQPNFHVSETSMPLDGSFVEEVLKMSMDDPHILSHDLSLTESVPLIGAEDSHTSFLLGGCCPDIIEGYCLSDLRLLSELSVGIHSDELYRYKPRIMESREMERGTAGWYGGNSLNVLENHISGESGQVRSDAMFPSNDSSVHTEACGRIILRKIDLRLKMYGGSDWLYSKEKGHYSGRDATVCLELALSGMKFQYDIFPVGGVRVSKMSVCVQDFHLYDRSRDAPWKMVLGYYHSKGRPRESSSKAFKLDLEAVRPDPQTPLEEYRLNVALLPMLLHLHQSQLDFLVNFFGRKSPLNDQYPKQCQDLEASKCSPEKRKDLAHHTISSEALLPYFQKLDIWPILVRVDYSPHHVDLTALRHGKYVELVNLVPWKGVELNLKHIHAAGIYGWGSVCETVIGEWLEDISQNQIHKILRGLPTVRSVIAVGSGAAKLVSSPVENYKKERRVLKGMQRGTIAFLRSISLEAIGLGVHLAAGTHDILLQAEYILASLPSSVPWPVNDKLNTDVRSNQPKDAQQGIQQAYESLSDGLGKSAAVLVQNPLKKYQRGSGAGPALAAAVRAVPAAAIAPASACAGAVHSALLGIRNSLDPDRKKESMEKYCPTEPWEED